MSIAFQVVQDAGHSLGFGATKLSSKLLQEQGPIVRCCVAEEELVDGRANVDTDVALQESKFVLCLRDPLALIGRLNPLYSQIDVLLIEGWEVWFLPAPGAGCRSSCGHGGCGIGPLSFLGGSIDGV